VKYKIVEVGDKFQLHFLKTYGDSVRWVPLSNIYTGMKKDIRTFDSAEDARAYLPMMKMARTSLKKYRLSKI